MELEIYLEDENDLAIDFVAENEREKNLLELRRLAVQIHESSFGDPIEWEREIRRDRDLPFLV